MRTIRIDAQNAAGPLIVMALWGYGLGFMTPHERCSPYKPQPHAGREIAPSTQPEALHAH